ncbi:BamA/TamA family outer membrane protein [Lunatimonas salinarum]|uniref:translocation and assembly module lipoprotein TamL n=1 Tax=Lunatimonas salinarum TaxID=1774590 RepID=UPI001ADECAE5|nr:BamA/TamA family outer membrane protein [Lunatimonas salinarum]
MNVIKSIGCQIVLHGVLIAVFATSACSVKKFIPQEEQLYKGAKISEELETSVRDWKRVKEELEGLLRPKPNSKFLGMYIGLWAYYKGNKERPGFINRFLKDKLGESPVYLSSVNIPQTELLLNNRLENNGFFNNQVASEVITREKSALVSYQISVSTPYTLRNFVYDQDSTQLDRAIRELLEDTEIEEGDRFELSKLKSERTRLDQALKEQGYYNFNADFLLFETDTNQYEDKGFDLYLRTKQLAPNESLIPYEIGEITVFPNLTLDQSASPGDTTVIRGISFIQDNPISFNPHLLERYILLNQGEKYNATKSRLTSNRISGIGNYRYVNIRYTERDSASSDGTGFLDATISLSPQNKRSLRAEFQGVSKSNNFAGPAFLLSYRNRNIFQGGEILNVTGKVAYETQIASGEREGLSSFEFGLSSELIFPRVVFPIDIKERFAYSVPKTRISLGTEFQDRRGLYRLNSVSAAYGYFWNANRFVYHEINPISINFVGLSNTTPEFEEILESNPFLKFSFQQQFIAGISYGFSYSKLMDAYRTHSIYFGANLDLAGFGLDGLNRLLGSSTPNQFLGLDYAQYNKGEVDFRYYWRFSEESKLALRMFGGVGIPYGNSLSLPFVKQFFSGGPNSVRAFRIRSLGPGSYRPQDVGIGSFFDQAGDVRLEANLEYRFPIVSFFKGAVFADAGNVWLMNENEALPGGKISSNWFRELGVGAGVGLRVDVDFFVLRFDFATPLRTPYLREGERWSREFRLDDSKWRRENLVFNFAIGYPF